MKTPDMEARRCLASVAVITTLLGVGAGCGSEDIGDDAPTRDALEDVITQRLDASPEQARCVADYLMQDYSAGELRVFAEEGIRGLPQGAWESYFTSTIACMTADPAVS